MEASIQELVELELLAWSEELEHCARCRRTMLVGEHAYVYDGDRTVCELCAQLERERPRRVHLVHGPAFGHTIRVVDRRKRASA
jgi:hypothetical protein